MSVFKEIKRIASSDGKRELLILVNTRSLFTYEENALITEEGHTFWTPTGGGGWYDSAEAAERDARSEIAWLRTENSN
jgi:hypothetical protein